MTNTFALGAATGLVALGLACGIVGCAFAALAASDPVNGLGSLTGLGGVVSCFKAASTLLDAAQ